MVLLDPVKYKKLRQTASAVVVHFESISCPDPSHALQVLQFSCPGVVLKVDPDAQLVQVVPSPENPAEHSQ